MRVLTKQEKAVFDAAFTSIMRVATVDADTVIDIRADGRPLPGVYVGLMMDIGGMERMQHLFCPMNKEEAAEYLISYCFANRVQPREFIFDGLLSINRRFIPVVEHTHVNHNLKDRGYME